ncbi:unnamed protein product, partial [Rotaria magnacalcarata]
SGSLPVRLATIKEAEACFVAQKSKNNSTVARCKSALLEVIDGMLLCAWYRSPTIAPRLSKVEQPRFHHHQNHHGYHCLRPNNSNYSSTIIITIKIIMVIIALASIIKSRAASFSLSSFSSSLKSSWLAFLKPQLFKVEQHHFASSSL